MSAVNGIEAEIMKYITQRFPLARKRNLDEQTFLLDSGIIDSMGVLDIVGFLETAFGVSVSDDELTPENFRNIASLSGFVRGKRAGTVSLANE